jgi:carboxynorspermidine decarboxylase
MDIQEIKDKVQVSPAFILDEDLIIKALKALATFRECSKCKILYSIKALPLSSVLELTKPYVDGFSVSSLFEARLANEVLLGGGGIHLTTPGIRSDEIDGLTTLCSHISGNSISQYQQIVKTGKKSVSLGLRVNPKLSFTEDKRFDPCRQFSKLGADISDVIDSAITEQIEGLHFHTVFSATDYSPLIQTLDKLQKFLGNSLSKLDWLNLGGGYLFDQIDDRERLIELISSLKNEFDLDVFIEPGNAVVGKAGYLLATVIDSFNSDGKAIAVLDTSTNHHPEVFEYQRQPELFEHDSNGCYPVILAGSTCLAGDLFGEYCFNKPLLIGDKLVFKGVGAYSLVKANRFNGYNLPDVYLAKGDQVKLVKQHAYHNYRQQWMSD